MTQSHKFRSSIDLIAKPAQNSHPIIISISQEEYRRMLLCYVIKSKYWFLLYIVR